MMSVLLLGIENLSQPAQRSATDGKILREAPKRIIPSS